MLCNRIVLAVSISGLLAGCASQIMAGYVGKPLSQAVIDYGPPTTAFDMGDGRRAFIWVRNNQATLPGYANTSGTTIGGNIYATTTITPPANLSWQCQYVGYGKRIRTDIEGPAAWQIVGFEPPKNFMCE